MPRFLARALAATACLFTTPRARARPNGTSAMACVEAPQLVTTPHAFTARMCAGTRAIETRRRDRLFEDHLAHTLAGEKGRAQPMGDWIMVPRTRRGDDLLTSWYGMGVRQLVLLGAGMDTRAYRMEGIEDLTVFEVDQQNLFDVKEPLLEGEPLLAASRVVVPTEFTDPGRWARDLEAAGFRRDVATVWLLEGLLMYLSMDDTIDLMQHIGRLSAPGSGVFHDAISEHHLQSRIQVAGAPFIGGSDEYGVLWAKHAGFQHSRVRDFSAIHVDRYRRKLIIDDERVAEATPNRCRGRDLVLFVEAMKK